MQIEYTLESVENQPGPNVYWRGAPDEYLRLLFDLHALGSRPGVVVEIGSLPYAQLVGIASYTFRSISGGETLVRKSGGDLVTELDPRMWRGFLHNVLSITFFPSFVYQDIDDAHGADDATCIMGSIGPGGVRP